MRPAIPSERSWPFEDALETDQEWAKYNRPYWKRDYIGFLQFFFAKCFNEPHSSKQIEDLPQTIPQTLVDITRGIDIPRQESFRETCARVRCPTLVIQGDRDLIGPHAQGAALARATRENWSPSGAAGTFRRPATR